MLALGLENYIEKKSSGVGNVDYYRHLSGGVGGFRK